MANLTEKLEGRPGPGSDYRAASKWRPRGLVLGVLGMMIVAVAVIAGVVAGNAVDDPSRGNPAAILSWAFGVNVLGLSVLKLGIVATLVGILGRLWLRVESVKSALPSLKGSATEPTPIRHGEIDTPYGRATVSPDEPKPLFIHRMARAMWLPSIVMGAMLVAAGFIVSLVEAGKVDSAPDTATTLSSWVQGLQFLGEGFILAGIAFVLGTILGSLRKGGGEVQNTLGVAVKTLKMPFTAKLFVGLMMLGLMVAIFQFIVYVAVATFDSPTTIASYFAWLGPVREAGLGLILAGIVLALATIGRVLAFQFHRITEIVTIGR